MKYIILNYELSCEMQYYRGKQIQIERNERAGEGYLVRDSTLTIGAHSGTHIDYPAHFVKDGKFGNEYPFDYLFSSMVGVVHIDISESSKPVLSADDLDLSHISKDCEIVLIKTGFCNLRAEERYWANSPVIDAEIPLVIKKQLPMVKAVCFDIISVKSLSDAEEGVLCHLNFLSDKGGRSVLIIEDADLRNIRPETRLVSIKIIPLPFERMEGCPCSIIAGV